MDKQTGIQQHIVSGDDFQHLRLALQASGLPSADINCSGRTFYRFEQDGHLIGFGGVERYAEDGLLRSVVVVPALRGKGFGGQVLAQMEGLARAAGIKRLHLLTTTATDFFKAQGYRLTERALAPAQIAGTEQFATLCPSTADYLIRDLAKTPP